MKNDRNNQAVMIVSGDFLIGVRGAAARRCEFPPDRCGPFLIGRRTDLTIETGLIFISWLVKVLLGVPL